MKKSASKNKMSDQEDIYYINKALIGHAASFATLIDRHKQIAYTLALRISKNHEDAEEIAQDAFLKSYNALSTFKQESKFSTWLYKIVYNTAISKLRKKELDSYSLDEFQITDTIQTQEVDGLRLMHAQERKKIINEAIGRLKEAEGIVLTLFYLSENNIREIEKITGYSVSNIKTLLYRGRNSLLFELKKTLKNEIIDIL